MALLGYLEGGRGGAHLPGTCERQVIIWRALSVASREKCTRRLCKRASLSIGSPSGKYGGGAPLPGTETEGRPCSLRTPRDMKKTVQVMGISVRRVPVGETWRRGLFIGDFERQVKELLQGKPTNEHTS